MRIVVVGATGLVGDHLRTALVRGGHEVVPVARSLGIDATTGEGLQDAMQDAQAVVDVTNTSALDHASAEAFFATTTRSLLAAESNAGVGHHVVLSIVGVERVPSNSHYAGKLAQERVAREGSVPVSVLRATQFYEFPEMVASWTRDGDTVKLPPLLVQPVAAAEVASFLAEIATGAPLAGARFVEFAGPERHDFVDMARRALEARGDRPRIVPAWQVQPFSVEMAGDVLLPGDEARIASITFDEWLTSTEPG